MTTLATSIDDTVYHIQEDSFVPGNLLIADGCVLKTSDGTVTSTIAGGPHWEPGYAEGVGVQARFNKVLSFVQISSHQVVLVDSTNRCLRSVDRNTNQTAAYAGNCTQQGQQDGLDALFNEPTSVIINTKNSSQLIIVEPSHASLRIMGIFDKNVSTMFRRGGSGDLQRMVQSPTTGNIYITFSHGVGLYDYQSKTFTRIAGAPTGMGFRDGLFSQMLFLWPIGIEFLDSRTLIVADSLSNRLRVLDQFKLINLYRSNGTR